MYTPLSDRYDRMKFSRCGRSGLMLPAISLGLWHNFGDDRPTETARAICTTAFDRGITHFDLANNYGPPPGAAEAAFGQMLRTTFAGMRDELIISTKAGYRMWPGPYGEWGSRKSLLASLDQSLKRLGIDYVDIFYSHRYDPTTPLSETMLALDAIVRQGKALYVGLSSYTTRQTRAAMAILRELKTPCIVHQPSYSMLNRWIEEDGLIDTLEEEGLGCVIFSPLAQGLLSTKYLDGVPPESRGSIGNSPRLVQALTHSENFERVRALAEIAAARGQSLPQMALAWALRDPRITSAVIGASRPEQVLDCLGALSSSPFTSEEIAKIDLHAKDGGFNMRPPE
jgi:L-glyceraldehyde 3-phosphate reductase